MAGCAADRSAVGVAQSLSETGGGIPLVGGFFLLCTGPNEDKSREVGQLQTAFAELGFASPEIIRTDRYIIAAYPSFQSRSAALKRYPNGDFIFVCGTCLSDRDIGIGAAACLDEGIEDPSPSGEDLMGHYAVVLQKNGRTEIKLDRFGGYHLFYNL